ncbi:MAG: hypothetical protein M3Y54_10485 [Bacteroidota bacterium]|nr:hypothetical protein [Bacteroidota bacterium]
MKRLTYPLLLAALLGLSQCHKKDPEPVDQLPPATQTGATPSAASSMAKAGPLKAITARPTTVCTTTHLTEKAL